MKRVLIAALFLTSCTSVNQNERYFHEGCIKGGLSIVHYMYGSYDISMNGLVILTDACIKQYEMKYKEDHEDSHRPINHNDISGPNL